VSRVKLSPFYVVKVTGKGLIKMIYIPKEVQDALGIEVGDYFVMSVDAVDKVITLRLLKPKEVSNNQ